MTPYTDVLTEVLTDMTERVGRLRHTDMRQVLVVAGLRYQVSGTTRLGPDT